MANSVMTAFHIVGGSATNSRLVGKPYLIGKVRVARQPSVGPKAQRLKPKSDGMSECASRSQTGKPSAWGLRETRLLMRGQAWRN
jgi:hypothetical protein